jgi:hypothetical protein
MQETASASYLVNSFALINQFAQTYLCDFEHYGKLVHLNEVLKSNERNPVVILPRLAKQPFQLLAEQHFVLLNLSPEFEVSILFRRKHLWSWFSQVSMLLHDVEEPDAFDSL